MKTREQIETEHSTNIQNIRASHLERKEISHEEYHNQLNTEGERHKTELIAEGYSLSVSPTQQEEWAKADTADKKLAILAKMQGLEG